MVNTISLARKNGYVKNLFGRIRRLPNINSSDVNERAESERYAVNTPIQGGVADLVAITMRRVYDKLILIHSKAYQILTVHDSIIWNVPVEEVDLVKGIIKEETSREIPGINVPFDVDIKIAKNWSMGE